MPVPQRSSRDRMIDATETLLCERGLAGAGIKQLVARSGAPIGSVYHFFPGGKTQLVAETLRLHAGKARRLSLDYLATENQPFPARVRALFRAAALGFEGAGAKRSCAIAAVTLDLDAADRELQEVCRSSFDQWIDAIAAHVPGREPQRRSFATMIVLSLEGAFILGRATHSGDAFTCAGEWLARLAGTLASSSTGDSHANVSATRRGHRMRRTRPAPARRARHT